MGRIVSFFIGTELLITVQ